MSALTPLLQCRALQWFGWPTLETKETLPELPVFRWVWAAALLGFWVLAAYKGTGMIAAGVLGLTGLAVIELLWLWRRQRGSMLNLLPAWQPLDGWVLAFFATAVAAACWSSVQPESWNGLAKLCLFGLSYGTFRWAWARHAALLPWQVLVWLGVGVWQALVGWQQVSGASDLAGPLATWTDPTLDQTQQLTRIVGTIQTLNPNLLAGFLIPVVGLAWGGLVWAIVTFESLRTRLLWGAIGLAFAVLLTWALVMTGSRGAYLSLVAMATLLYMAAGHLIFHDLKQHRWLRWAWIGVAVIGVLGVVGVVVSSEKLLIRVTSIVSGDSSTGYRMMVYRAAFRMLADNWLLGIGPGNLTFQQVYGYYQTPGFNALAAYCLPLEIWLEQGLLGILSFVGVVITLFSSGLAALEATDKPLYQRWWLCTLWAALGGMLVYGIFDTVWYRPIVNVFFWALAAMLPVLWAMMHANQAEKAFESMNSAESATL